LRKRAYSRFSTSNLIGIHFLYAFLSRTDSAAADEALQGSSSKPSFP
jgi:hypothetical protein